MLSTNLKQLCLIFFALLTLLSLASCEGILCLGEAVILASFGITVVFFQLILI